MKGKIHITTGGVQELDGQQVFAFDGSAQISGERGPIGASMPPICR